MADFYLDISAVGNEYQAYAAAPTWGALATDKPAPQDGNGKAGPGHSAAVSIAEIQLTALPADGNTLAIAGATLTAKTTAAAKNQWTIGASIATCVSNLVSLLNTYGTSASQCDAAVSSSVCALVLALPYWQYARVKPGTTDTLQIATRIAGSDLNHAANSNVAITSSGWGTPPTITQFAGGADGPFGYAFNSSATIFGKSANTAASALPAYGVFFAAAPGPSDPGASDVVHIRSRRSGVDLSASWSNSATASGTWKQRSYLADNGTVWSGDNGKITFTFKNVNSSSTTHAFYVASAGFISFASRGQYNLEFQTGSTLAASPSHILFAGAGTWSRISFRNCRHVETADNVTGRPVALVGDNGTSLYMLVDLSGSMTVHRATMKGALLFAASNTIARVVMHGFVAEVNAATGPLGPCISMINASSVLDLEWVCGEVRDSLGVYRCVTPLQLNVSQGTTQITIDSVIGITDASVGWTASYGNTARLRWVSAEGPNKAFRIETPQYTVDWRGDGTFPYCGAAADLRGVGWSHRVTWTAAPLHSMAVTALKLSRFHRSAAAQRTLTMELYVPDATTIYDDELQMVVAYIDSTDVPRIEQAGGLVALQFSSTRSPLASSSASWTANGVASFSAKKLELTTAYEVKENSEVTVSLALCKARSPSLVVYVSPELGLA